MKINTTKYNFFDVNKKINFFIADLYGRDYKTLDFKVLITKFKDYYKSNPFK